MGQSVCHALTADSTASTTYKGQEKGWSCYAPAPLYRAIT